MASKNYIPTPDAVFKLWAATLVTVLGEEAAAYGVTTAQTTALSTSMGLFNAAYAAHLDAQLAAKSATAAKADARHDFVELIRQVVKQIQANPAVTPAMKESIGITVPEDHKSPAPVPTSYPIPQVEDIEALTHTLRYADSATNTRAKPDGVRAAEVWMTILPPGNPIPTDPSALQLVDIASTSKITQTFAGDDANKTAVYRLRWLNTRNEKGPWGPVVTATIAA